MKRLGLVEQNCCGGARSWWQVLDGLPRISVAFERRARRQIEEVEKCKQQHREIKWRAAGQMQAKSSDV